MSFTLSKDKKQKKESMKNAANIKLRIIDLDEISEQMDISVNIKTKSSPEAAKRPLKREKTIALF